MRFNELWAKINETSKISQPTLSKHLKQLRIEAKIEIYWNEKRGGDCYRIKPENREKVEAQIQKDEAREFIESLSEPIYVHQTSKDKTMAISAFASIPKKNPKIVKWFMDTVGYYTTFYSKAIPKLSESEKIAIVIMMSGKKKSVKP